MRSRRPSPEPADVGGLLMYGALWRVLPGPWWVRTLILLVAIAAVLAACVFWVFPWVAQFVEPQEVTVA